MKRILLALFLAVSLSFGGEVATPGEAQKLIQQMDKLHAAGADLTGNSSFMEADVRAWRKSREDFMAKFFSDDRHLQGDAIRAPDDPHDGAHNAAILNEVLGQMRRAKAQGRSPLTSGNTNVEQLGQMYGTLHRLPWMVDLCTNGLERYQKDQPIAPDNSSKP